MKKLYLNTGGINTIFNDLKDSLNGTLTLENNQYNLSVNSKNANGVISGISLNKQISYFQFNIFFNQDIELSIESFVNSPILFTYCFQGSLTHSFGINGERKKIKSNQTGIIRNTSNINSVLHFEGYKHVEFSIICVNTHNAEMSENSRLFVDINKVFNNKSGHYAYAGQQNSKIADKIKEFHTVPQKGIVKNLLKNRILESVLEVELDQHTYGYAKDIKPIAIRANKQIEELKRVSNLNLLEVFSGVGQVSRSYLSKVIKEKYHLAFSKLYNQKLVS
ncbi:hypothetical protein [Flavobacterium limi]|uniref:Uncharacterized protein n=1 Tax=Flavobacterium limi TaxID=2045105 RepID=A0ABQ1UEB0_9FLAO|nr:hypothetical protein [Flavobacterium limi]GGF15998.1 hypothetical protein GCM10011518_26700 [Flavobacterium limi]